MQAREKILVEKYTKKALKTTGLSVLQCLFFMQRGKIQ